MNEKKPDVAIHVTLPESDFDSSYYYAVFVVKKKDHQEMLRQFKSKEPCDVKQSINLGMILKNFIKKKNYF